MIITEKKLRKKEIRKKVADIVEKIPRLSKQQNGTGIKILTPDQSEFNQCIK